MWVKGEAEGGGGVVYRISAPWAICMFRIRSDAQRSRTRSIIQVGASQEISHEIWAAWKYDLGD